MPLDASIVLAEPRHLPFVRAMLFEAAFWRADRPRPPLDQGLARPEIARILEDWGHRPGDVALVATVGGRDAGAAWYRFWTERDHSFGFIDGDTPEIGIGILAEFRGRGLGKALTRALMDHAQKSGIRRLSLSVEADNARARRLYRSAGFRDWSYADNAHTMLAGVDEVTRRGSPSAWSAMDGFPELRTAHLLIRRMGEADVPGCAEILCDREEGYFVTDSPVEPVEVAEKVRRHRDAWQAGSSIHWAIDDGSGILGFVALHGLVSARPAISYAVRRTFRRRGIAMEAVAAVADFARDTLARQGLKAATHEENVASAALLRKLGFTFLGLAETDRGPRRQYEMVFGGTSRLPSSSD